MIPAVAGTVFSPARVTDFCKCAVTALGSRSGSLSVRQEAVRSRNLSAALAQPAPSISSA